MTSKNTEGSFDVSGSVKHMITLSDRTHDEIMEVILGETLAQQSTVDDDEPHHHPGTADDGKEIEIELSIGITPMNDTPSQIMSDDDHSNTNDFSQYISVKPDFSTAIEILNQIPDFHENKTGLTPSILNEKVSIYPDTDTGTTSLLKTQKLILSQKVETLTLMVSDYTTKFKEYKMQLQYQFNQEEQYYVNRIEALEHQIKNQKLKLQAQQKQLKKQLMMTSTSIDSHCEREGIDYNQRLHIFECELKRQSKQLKELNNIQQENMELLATNTQHENTIQRQYSRIALLEQMCALSQSMKSAGTIRVLKKSTTANRSSSQTRDKLTYHTFKQAGESSEDVVFFEHTNRIFGTHSLFPFALRITERTEPSFDDEDDKSKVQEYQTKKGKLVIKQLTDTNICVNMLVEIVESVDNNTKFDIMIYFDRTYSVKQLSELLRSSNTMNQLHSNYDLYIYCADDDGELGDDAIALDNDQIISELGIINFYVRIIINKKKNDDDAAVNHDVLPVGTMCNDNCVIV